MTQHRLRLVTSGALAFAYALLPSSQHALFPGVPLSLVGAGVLVFVCAVFAVRDTTIGWRSVALLAFLLVVKAGAAATLPRHGFQGTYYANDSFAGEPYRRIDTVLDFDAATFPRSFFNERSLATSNDRQLLPFSVVWRGTVVLREPAFLLVEGAASEPLAVTVDGEALHEAPLLGVHDIEVRLARRTPTSPWLHVRVEARDPPGNQTRQITVFAERATARAARFSEEYAPIAVWLDVMLLGWLLWSMAGDVGGMLARPWPARWAPSLPIVALGVVVFWFIVAAVRIGPHFYEMDFLTWNDDWIGYEATARRVVAGHLGGQDVAVLPATFLYPYFLAALHIVFGESILPLYFAQHLTFALTCILSGLLARALWGERMGVAVLAATCAFGFLDVYRWYMTRLLSENLVLPVAPLVLLVVHSFLKRPGLVRAVLAGALLGAAALVRTNLLPFAAMATIYLVFRPMAADRRTAVETRIALVAGCLLTYGLFPLREYLVTGVARGLPWEMATLNYVTYPGSFMQRLHTSWWAPVKDIVLPNIAFMLGYPKFSVAVYSIRPHWLILWMAYAAWIWRHRHTPTPPGVWMLHLYIAANVAPLLPYGFIGVYGFRYLLPLIFGLCLFLPGGMLALSEVVTTWWRRRPVAGDAVQ